MIVRLLTIGIVGCLTAVSAYAQPASPVEVAEVVERAIAEGRPSVATVEPVRSAVIGSAVDGRVVEFLVDAGDRVESGQKLAQLLTETIQLELEAAKAELALQQHELDELRNGTRPEEIEQRRAAMAAAKAAQEYQQQRRKRVERLFAGGASTDEALDESLSASIAAAERYREAQAAYELAVAGTRKEEILQAEARVTMQQAMVDQLEDRIRKHGIISRFDGYVTAEYTESGAWVARGDPVAEVVALDEIDVVANVPEQQVPFLKIGQSLNVAINALPDEQLTGTVIAIVPQADQLARTFPVKVRVKNRIDDDGQPVAKAGMQARVSFPTGRMAKTLLVPKDALVLGGASPSVFVVSPDPKNSKQSVVNPVPVTPGRAEGDWISVTGDLSAGQQVVVLGNERLRPGQAVSVKQR